ncbi:MAG: efflux RND transporter permease subunit [Rhodospirillales bacterium]|nr:efflux RND transporter permease subunit [Rhodospirillales bacterium]
MLVEPGDHRRGGRTVTRYKRDAEQYDVIVQTEARGRTTPENIDTIYVRGRNDAMIPLTSLVNVRESVSPRELNHFGQRRSATITANLSSDYSLGQAITFMNETAAKVLKPGYTTDLNDTSREFKNSQGALGVVFVLALVFIFLVLAAQFESFVDPLVIMLAVPLSMVGGVFNAVNPTVHNSREKPVPAKQAYGKKDQMDWARFLGLSIHYRPSVFPVNSVKVMRACCWLEGSDALVPFAQATFEAYWRDDKDISQVPVITEICRSAGLDPDALLAAIETQPVKDKLRANTQELIDRGGFGSPTMFVGGDDMYFGNDRMPLIRMIEGSGGGGSVKTIETKGRSNLPGEVGSGAYFQITTENMEVVPVVALGLGSVAGLGSARLAASHYSVMTKSSAMFVARFSACTWAPESAIARALFRSTRAPVQVTAESTSTRRMVPIDCHRARCRNAPSGAATGANPCIPSLSAAGRGAADMYFRWLWRTSLPLRDHGKR